MFDRSCSRNAERERERERERDGQTKRERYTTVRRKWNMVEIGEER